MLTPIPLLVFALCLILEVYLYYKYPLKFTAHNIHEICKRDTTVGTYDHQTASALESYLTHIFRVIVFAYPDINCCDLAMQWNKECNNDPEDLLSLAIIHAWDNVQNNTSEPDFELFQTLPKCLVYNDYIDLCSFERRVHDLCQK